MPATTLVLPYYENPTMLQLQYKGIASLPASLLDQIAVTVVDDGSPQFPATPSDIGCPLQVWRIDVDIRWNQDAARNIGALHAETPWLLLTDMDHIVPEATWRYLLSRKWSEDTAYRFGRVSAPKLDPYKFHPNSWFLTKRKYQEVGGYDERFAGWYGTDGDFRDRIAASGEIVQLKQTLIRVPRQVVPDASTTGYLRKQPQDTEQIRRIKGERNEVEDWKPLNLTFPFHRVFPIDPQTRAKARV